MVEIVIIPQVIEIIPQGIEIIPLDHLLTATKIAQQLQHIRKEILQLVEVILKIHKLNKALEIDQIIAEIIHLPLQTLVYTILIEELPIVCIPQVVGQGSGKMPLEAEGITLLNSILNSQNNINKNSSSKLTKNAVPFSSSSRYQQDPVRF